MYLNCHSYFSLKYGTLSVEQLLAEAQRCGVKKLALTDINNTSAVLDFIRLAPKYGVEPVVGIDFRRGHVQCYVGIAKNNEGFHELNEFLTHCLRHGTNEVPDIPDIPPITENVFWIVPFEKFLQAKEEMKSSLADKKFPCFIGVKSDQLTRLRFSPFVKQLSRLVVWHPVTFRNPGDFNTHRLLRAVANNTLLSKIHAEDIASSI